MLKNIILRHASSSSNNKRLTYGFIGLGQMGKHMANNLITRSKANVVAFDVNQAAVQALIHIHPSHASSASSPKHVAEQSDVIVTMLPSPKLVEHVYLNAMDGVVAGLRAGTILIDSSTIDAKTSQMVGVKLKGKFKNITFVDAPVSGGVGGAEAGTLTFMVGADTLEDYSTVTPHLMHMGKTSFNCGKQGMGQVAKICNNMLLGISMIATSETLNLGIRSGMDPKVLSQIIGTSTGRNWSLDSYNPCPGVLPNVPSSRDYKGGFGIELMLKDMGLACQAASQTGSTVMLGALANELYRVISQANVVNHTGDLEALKGKDFSVVFKWLDDNSTKLKF